jgi:hypothetical protein
VFFPFFVVFMVFPSVFAYFCPDLPVLARLNASKTPQKLLFKSMAFFCAWMG